MGIPCGPNRQSASLPPPLLSRLFVVPGGVRVKPEPWNGHRSFQPWKPASRTSPAGRTRLGHLGQRLRIEATSLDRPPLPQAHDHPMGWQQYSCRLRLSRTNIYILYIIRATSHILRRAPHTPMAASQRETQPRFHPLELAARRGRRTPEASPPPAGEARCFTAFSRRSRASREVSPFGSEGLG